MVSRTFLKQLDGYGLTTAEIHYRLPDHPSLLQLYVWQDYDVALAFLVFWHQRSTARYIRFGWDTSSSFARLSCV